MSDLTGSAAYGGESWSPRTAPHRDELGRLWGRCGLRERFFEKAGLACRTTPIAELRLAAGGIACLTGILERTPGG